MREEFTAAINNCSAAKVIIFGLNSLKFTAAAYMGSMQLGTNSILLVANAGSVELTLRMQSFQ